jgi:hypothetical protein
VLVLRALREIRGKGWSGTWGSPLPQEVAVTQDRARGRSPVGFRESLQGAGWGVGVTGHPKNDASCVLSSGAGDFVPARLLPGCVALGCDRCWVPQFLPPTVGTRIVSGLWS